MTNYNHQLIMDEYLKLKLENPELDERELLDRIFSNMKITVDMINIQENEVIRFGLINLQTTDFDESNSKVMLKHGKFIDILDFDTNKEARNYINELEQFLKENGNYKNTKQNRGEK